MKKTTAAIAIAALAVPAAAQADRPENAGSQGREKAQQHQSKRHGKKSDHFRGRGFTVRGVDYKGPALTSSRESQEISDFTLDITSANRHARTYLGLTERPSKEQPAQDTSISDNQDGKARIRLVGFEEGETPDADDRVIVLGRTTRTRKSDGESTTTTTTTSERKLDIRRILVKDVDTTEAEKQQAEQEKAERRASRRQAKQHS